jgi:hypothetical protein
MIDGRKTVCVALVMESAVKGSWAALAAGSGCHRAGVALGEREAGTTAAMRMHRIAAATAE